MRACVNGCWVAAVNRDHPTVDCFAPAALEFFEEIRVLHPRDDVAGALARSLLDAGCGAGLALRLAADCGAEVTGLDATETLLADARRRVPGARLDHGDVEQLPYADGAFDVVTGLNAFQYASRPVEALREAQRVTRPGGSVLALVWVPADRCEAAPHLAAVGALAPPPPPGTPGSFALSYPGALVALMSDAGLLEVTIADVPGDWSYPDEATALRGLLSAGPVVKAIEYAGEDAVRAAIAAAVAPFRRRDGGYRLQNTFRYAVGATSRTP